MPKIFVKWKCSVVNVSLELDSDRVSNAQVRNAILDDDAKAHQAQ